MHTGTGPSFKVKFHLSWHAAPLEPRLPAQLTRLIQVKVDCLATGNESSWTPNRPPHACMHACMHTVRSGRAQPQTDSSCLAPAASQTTETGSKSTLPKPV